MQVCGVGMSKEKSPSYQHYPKDIMSDINYQMMSWEERGMYRHLLDLCWMELSLPNDPKIIARILNITDEKAFEQGAWPLLARCFTGGVALVHTRLEKERQKQAEWRAKSALGGMHSAHKRKHTKDISNEQGGTQMVPTKRQPKGNTAVCSLQFANKDICDIFEFWNSKPATMHHRKVNGQEGAIKASLGRYTSEEIKRAIERYSQVRANEAGKYRSLYAWTLGEFLTRQNSYNIERFNADNWEAPFLAGAFASGKPGDSRQTEQPEQQYEKVNWKEQT
jgi:uncharacterized protein YdaU (DUF1376 family)